MRFCLLGQDLTAFCREHCISRIILWEHIPGSRHPSHFRAPATSVLSHWSRLGIKATPDLPGDKESPSPFSFSESDGIHARILIWNFTLVETFWKIGTQAKRNYTFKRIYLLLRMFAFITCRLQRLACNECRKNPWCSISKTFITAVTVLITARTIPETFFFSIGIYLIVSNFEYLWRVQAGILSYLEYE